MNPVTAILLKVTLLLLAGWTVAGLLRHRSAAARHLVWVLSLSGVLLLTLLAPLAPTLPLRIAGIADAPVPVLTATAFEPGLPELAEPSAAFAKASSAAAKPGNDSGPVLGQLLLIGWLLGALGVAGWYLLGHLGLTRLLRQATPLSDAAWLTLGDGLARQQGITTPIRLFQSRAVGSPVIWGARRPVVLLPADAASWPAERRHAVLAHELAHAARGDFLARLIASLACTLYWFHPLAWFAARQLRRESERACDDQVLSRGVPGAEYAAHLLDVASRSGALRPGGAVAIGMARPSQLEGRLLAVLDDRLARQAPRRRARVVAWSALLLLVPPLTALRPVPHTTDSAPDASGANQIEPRDSVFQLSERAAAEELLTLDLESGGSVRLRGWNDPRVEVRVRLSGADWRDTRVTLERAGRGVRLHTWQGERSGITNHQFEIMVPKRFNLQLRSARGEVHILDVAGRFVGETGGGGFVIERVSGSAELSTGGGDIEVLDSELDGVVSTGGGTVRMSGVRGDLRGSSGSGPAISRNLARGERDDVRDVRVETDRIRLERQQADERRKLENDREWERRAVESEKLDAEWKLLRKEQEKELGAKRSKVEAEMKELRKEQEKQHAEEVRKAEAILKEVRKLEASNCKLETRTGTIEGKNCKAELRADQLKYEVRSGNELREARKAVTTARADEAGAWFEIRKALDEVEQERRLDRLKEEVAQLERELEPNRKRIDGNPEAERARRDALKLADRESRLEETRRGMLRIEKAGGDILLDEAPDGAELFTGGGRIVVGPSAGLVRARTGSGNIRIGPARGSVSAGSGAGNIEVIVEGDAGADQLVEVNSGYGTAVITLPASFSGRFDLETAYTNNLGRRTRIESAWQLEHEETSAWDSPNGSNPRKYVRARGQVGRGGGLIRVRVINGDVVVKLGET